MTKEFKLQTTFHIHGLDREIFFIEKVEEMISFVVQCLESHLPFINN